MYEHIPAELRTYKSWVLWKLVDRGSEKPTKVPFNPVTGLAANPVDPVTWGSFAEAVSAYANRPDYWNGIGFVLSDLDPYSFIDLDDCKGDVNLIKTQERIFKEFDSYSEISPSGSGLHIIVKGKVPRGARRSAVEVYSSERYMTMTGNVYHHTGIHDRDNLLNSLWAEMAKDVDEGTVFAGLPEERVSDEEVLRIANLAINADKFRDLYYEGAWAKYYPSQSEADYALINIIGFYSNNADQTRRIFFESKLGQRPKSRTPYRVNRMLAHCFDRMLPPVDLSGLRDQLDRAIAKAKEMEKAVVAAHKEPSAIELKENYLDLPPPKEMDDTPIRPPGLLGDIAEYIYAQAPRPVPEVAVAAAIGLMSGICGKAYNISRTGLNQYVMLVSLTGTGKESMSSGISKLMTEVKKTVIAANDFIGPSSIASEQALLKHLNTTSASFVSIFGEFAYELKQMNPTSGNPAKMGVGKMLLDMYAKSGHGEQVGSLIYSDKNNNTSSVMSPAFSILAESSPEIFYESLDEAMVTGGLLPRFLLIENKADRSKRNKGAGLVNPSKDLVIALSNLCANALSLNHSKKVIEVRETEEAAKLLQEFDELCDQNIVGSKEVRRQLWNRGHVKLLKLSALVACGINYYEPIITKECVEWAKAIILSGIRNLSTRFESGEVGVDNDELRQITRGMDVIKDYIMKPYSELGNYGVPSTLHAEKVVPYSYLQKRLYQTTPFRRDRMGPGVAVKRMIDTMVSRGDVVEIDKVTLGKKFGLSGRAFMIHNRHAFGF